MLAFNRLNSTFGLWAAVLVLSTSSDASADDPQSSVLAVDFTAVEEGDLPPGWEGPDAVGVRKDGDRAWIEASTKGLHEVKSPTFSLAGDFHLEMKAALGKGTSNVPGKLVFVLETASGEAMTSSVEQAWPGLGSEQWRVKMGDSAKVIDASLGKSAQVNLVRKGRVFQLLVDGEVVIARRLSQYREVTRVRIGLAGPETDRGHAVAQLHDLRITVPEP